MFEFGIKHAFLVLASEPVSCLGVGGSLTVPGYHTNIEDNSFLSSVIQTISLLIAPCSSYCSDCFLKR